MCVTFSRAWAAHAQKMMFYVRARARESEEDCVRRVKIFSEIQKIYFETS